MHVKTQVAGSHLQFLTAQVWGGVESTSFRPVPSCCWSRNHARRRHAESTPEGCLILSSLLGICSVSGHHPYRALPQAHLSHAHSSSPGLRQWFLNFLSPLSSHYLFAFMALSSTKLHLEHHNEVTAPLFWKLIRDKPELCQQLTITSVSTMR